MHRPHFLGIRKRKPLKNFTDTLDALLIRLMHKDRHLRFVPGYEEIPFPVLTKASVFSAIMKSFMEDVAVVAEEPLDSLEQFGAAQGDSRDVFKDIQ
jgi:hypothetical protein